MRVKKNGMSEKVNWLDVLKLYGYVLKLSLKYKKRTLSLINQEYNFGNWNRDITDSEIISLNGNYGKIGQIGIFAVNDKLVRMNYDEFGKNRDKEFLSFFENFKEDDIIELGCGLGGNLFTLYHAGFKNLEGCDLSTNAISKLKNFVEKTNIKINFYVHNLNEPFLNDHIKNKIVFTHTVLEQTKNIMHNVLNNIIKGCPKLVINFEVNYDDEGLLVRKYFDSRDYQNNLVKELKKLEKLGKISIINIKKMQFSGSPVNRLSVIIWKPNLCNPSIS